MNDSDLLSFLDEPEVRAERRFDMERDADSWGWWWVSFRNGKAYTAPQIREAIQLAKEGGP